MTLLLAPSNMFSLSLVFCNLTLLCQGIDFGIYCLSSLSFLELFFWYLFINFGKFLVIITSNTSAPLSLFLLFQLCICFTFPNCPIVCRCSVLFFSRFCFCFIFSSLNFNLKNVYGHYLQAHCLFPQLCPVYWWDHQRHSSFMLQYVSFISRFLLDS